MSLPGTKAVAEHYGLDVKFVEKWLWCFKHSPELFDELTELVEAALIDDKEVPGEGLWDAPNVKAFIASLPLPRQESYSEYMTEVEAGKRKGSSANVKVKDEQLLQTMEHVSRNDAERGHR